MLRAFLCALFSALLALPSPHSSLAQQQPVTAFAAASLQDALTSIAKKFTDQTGVPVRFSFGSSAALARQIDQGASADLFASADVDWMDWAVARNLIKPQTRVDLLGNRLVVVAPFDAKFSALARRGRIPTDSCTSAAAHDAVLVHTPKSGAAEEGARENSRDNFHAEGGRES